MGRKGSRYSVDDKLFYIGLVENENWSTYQIEHAYGIKHSTVDLWVKRHADHGIDGLKRRIIITYSAEFKTKVVQEYLETNISLPKLCEKYDISNPGVIYQWVSLYTSGKSLTTTRRRPTMKSGRTTTKKERVEIAQWTIANELDYSGAIEKFNVSYGQVYAWVKKFKSGGSDALADRRGKSKEDKEHLTEAEKQELEIKRLEARLNYVTTENKLLKKIQELERGGGSQKKPIKPSKNSQKK
jgi:transposase-like protein